MVKLKALIQSSLFIFLYLFVFVLVGIFYNPIFLVIPFAIPGIIYWICVGILEIKERYKKYDYID